MPITFFRHIHMPDNDLITRISPDEILTDFVEGFYVFKAQDLSGRQLFFNDGYPVVALMQQREGGMRINVNGKTVNIGNAWVCGGMLKNIYCESSGDTAAFFVIRFHPATFFKLFNIRENIFEHNSVFDLMEIAPHDAKLFLNDFYSASSVDKKVTVAADFLSRKISAIAVPALLGELINHIEKNPHLTVKDLSKAYGVRLNYKWLERNFKKYIGISPKEYLLLKRFLNAYRSLDALSSKTLLEIALDNGYCDDNHLIKDFRIFSGQSPKAFFQDNRRA
ncbi:AraC family transcriptional regulator [Chitinophaga rhizophila]|uniref:AraC family transcriptional regulator n=1 Tax=Chitinophaga rhizophila TaxID=2866212 RepID=A0ABS7G6A1_9BACT|nr:helix-turn-helix domain-containing protein [Chitinophaga rhizophila]MBW8683139.1 AraC family transcriptional regulator [Chitinophaga rhizophila]